MLKIEHLNSGYDKKQVLYDISLEIQQGDIALLIGSNGSGKSTLLKAIYGLCKVWSGNVLFNDENITNSETSSLLKKGIMYISQKNNVFEQLTVKENLEISGLALENKVLFQERLEIVLTQFQILKPFLKQHPMKMSGGERQQLVLAMALIHQPKLLLIDEPYTGLSGKTIDETTKILTELNQNYDVTILMVEHRIKEAKSISNQAIGLKLGKILYDSKEMSKFDQKIIHNILI